MEQRGVFLQYLEWELSIADERKTPEVARRGLLREGQEGATRSLGEEEGEEKKTRERRADGFSRACPLATLSMISFIVIESGRNKSFWL